MKIRWHLIDELLALTSSTAQELFDWLNNPKTMRWEFPCNEGFEYLDKWSLHISYENDYDYTDEVILNEEDLEIYIPDIATNVSVFSFWEDFRVSEDFRADMNAKFKERYNL